MLKTLWLGFFLRCPNCERGPMSSGLFQLRETCPNCAVRFERRSGESTGAMIIMLSLLPFLGLVLFFILYAINRDYALWVLLGAPLALIVLIGVLGYRHVRGLWVAIIHLTGGLYTDADAPQQPAPHDG